MTNVVTDLIIYPIKGLAGIHRDKAKAHKAGFEFDRRWMLIDAQNHFVTQRSYAEMALFTTDLEGEILKTTFNNNSFSFNMHETTGKLIQTQVWNDNAVTEIVSLQANEWFSDILQKEVKLVKIKDDNSRMHYSSASETNFPVSLADGYPYLIIGEKSLTFLNQKLSNPVSMSRFRPNIVVSSNLEHEEDQWKSFSIGSASFLNMKPCGRCSVIAIDQETAKIDQEPIKILNDYRKSGNNIFFGTNLVCTEEGSISVGDQLRF